MDPRRRPREGADLATLDGGFRVDDRPIVPPRALRRGGEERIGLAGEPPWRLELGRFGIGYAPLATLQLAAARVRLFSNRTPTSRFPRDHLRP